MRDVDICFVSPGLLEAGTKRGGGCEVTDYNVALQLSQHFNIVILSTFHKYYKKKIIINEKFSIEQVPISAQKIYPPKSQLMIFIMTILMWLLSFFIAIKTIGLKIRGLKIIVVHNPQTALFSTLLAKLINIKVIYAEGNTTPWTKPYVVSHQLSLKQKFWHFFNLHLSKFMCILADGIRAQSISIKMGMVKEGINPTKIRIIPAGVDPNVFKPINVKTSRDRLVKVAFIGRLTEEKGAPLLLSVVQKAEKEPHHVRFLIFGDGPYKHQLRELTNIEHLGTVPRDQLNSRLSEVQISLFFQKELGRAELEAMAAGKAIIACNIGEMPQIIRHLENGVLCAPDANSYINAIDSLSKNPILMKKISEKARETAIKRFTWEGVAIQWLLLCREVLSGDIEYEMEEKK